MSNIPCNAPHPLDPLTASEIQYAADVARFEFRNEKIRFCYITLKEQLCPDVAESSSRENGPKTSRIAEVVIIVPSTGIVNEIEVALPNGKMVAGRKLVPGTQPCFTPDDCLLAEEIVKSDSEFVNIANSRYGITDLTLLACDPWSVHIASRDFAPLNWRTDGLPPRLIQTFLYKRHDQHDNHYAHPLDVVPVVDLNAQRIVCIDGMDRPAPALQEMGVNYHRRKLSSNSYMQKEFRSDLLAPLHISQPEGPSFRVSGNFVQWQKWSFRVGFNYREGLILRNVAYDNRPIVARASIVEMAVPYGDPHDIFARKCAFDVGDYGLGFCSNSLELGCDCLGHIHYFDGVLSNCEGKPYVVKKVVCMHEEDSGILWKHVEYRTGYSEARRSRRLVLSFIATVVNYEYLFYWYLSQDGGIDFEIKLSGELSTNVLSEGESEPGHGVIVAPGVNAQIHQHMFCVRLVMSVDGPRNSICEINVERQPSGPQNPFGNAFKAVATELRTEKEAQRKIAPGRVWKIYNPHSLNKINGKAVGYKLIPGTRGGVHPLLLPLGDSAVAERGKFATNTLWVTPLQDNERYPAGDYPAQNSGGEGLPKWTMKNRVVEYERIVIWHSFGVTHVPRIEDFPVMSCEVTGFSLRPDSFFSGNDAIDLRPDVDRASTCCGHG